MEQPKLKCDTCGTEENIAGVAACPFGPISLCYCRTCVDKLAEPEWILEFLYSQVGTEGEGLHESVKQIVTYKDGEYWSWERWVKWRKDNPPPKREEVDGC